MNLIDFKGESGKDGARTACFAYVDATPLVRTDLNKVKVLKI